jgi:uncharacterized membrane protein
VICDPTPQAVRLRWFGTPRGDAVEWVKLGHVLFAAVWFGGAVYVEAIIASAKRTNDPMVMGTVAKRIGATNPALFGVSGILTLAFGIWLILYDGSPWEFSDMFVSIGFLVVILVLGMGILFFAPQGKKIEQIIAERGPTDPEVKVRGDRIASAMHISTLLLLVGMVVMVIKPGL